MTAATRTMADRAAPTSYSGLQIALHWIIAALVVAQFAVNADVRIAFRDRVAGAGAEGVVDGWAWFHIIAGLVILALTALRLMIRLVRGAPAAEPGIPPFLALLATLAHIALYGFLLLMPLTGALAWFTGSAPFGTLHEIGRLILIPLIGVHALAALIEHFVMRNDTLRRMLRATSR